MTTQQSALPEVDHHDPSWSEDTVWSTYERLRSQCPVAHSDRHGGYYLLTRYEDVRAAAKDAESFSSAGGIRIPALGEGRSIPIEYDAPMHTAYRALFFEATSRSRITAMTPSVKELIGRLIADFHAAGGGDAVAAVALPLPLQVLIELVGFSAATVARLRELTETSWTKVTTTSLDEARAGIRAVIEDEMARHRAEQPADYLTWLLSAEVEGRPITDDEIARVLITFAIAGHETTVNAVGGLFHVLASDSALQARLRADRALVAGFVEEVLRVRSPAQLFARETTRDITVSGTTIPAGERVLLSFAAANRDPTKFAEPDAVQPDRGAGHLAFGWGPHQCVGAALARIELREVCERLLDLPPIRPAAPPDFGSLTGGIHLGPRHLPIEFTEEPRPRSTEAAH